jgi:hypothetical protein
MTQIVPIACAAIVWWLYCDFECWINGATGRWRAFLVLLLRLITKTTIMVRIISTTTFSMTLS